MNPEQLREFLSKKYLMDISTITPEGYPHVTPVWFEWDGTVFWANTTEDRKKAKNIRANSKVGFSIAPYDLPYAAVVGYGKAELTDDPGAEHIRKLAHRYLPADKADKYADSLAKMGKRVTIKITPKWMRSWQG